MQSASIILKIENGLNPRVKYQDRKWLSELLESSKGMLLATDVSTTWYYESQTICVLLVKVHTVIPLCEVGLWDVWSSSLSVWLANCDSHDSFSRHSVGFWIFNWLRLSLDSEDRFRTGSSCRNVSRQQQSQDSNHPDDHFQSRST